MKTEKVVASFLKVASEDLEGARILAKAQNRNAIYLCSQAAEKVILNQVNQGVRLVDF